MNNNDIFRDENIAGGNWIQWGKVGDNVYGTLVHVGSMPSRLPGKEGQKIMIYEIKVDGGEFHQIQNHKVIEPAVELMPGENWSVSSRGVGMDGRMRSVKLGQKFGLKFMEEIPSTNKALNAAKSIKVFIPKDDHGNPVMDEEFLKELNAPVDPFGDKIGS